METKEVTKVVEMEEKSGEELISEYMAQDNDFLHSMGYGVYGQTYSDSCC